jgi:hypothetical protein
LLREVLKSKHNEARRDVYARIEATQKIKHNKARRDVYARKNKEFKGGNRVQKKTQVRSDEQIAKRKETARKTYAREGKKRNSQNKAIRKILFAANPEAKNEYKLKNKIASARYRLKKKMEKMEDWNVAEIMVSIRERKAVPLVDENDNEDGEMIEDTDDGGVEKEEVKNEGSEEEEIDEN